MPGAVADERRRHIPDAIQVPDIRRNPFINGREVVGATRRDGFASRVRRQLHHLPRRTAFGRVVRRDDDGIDKDAAFDALRR